MYTIAKKMYRENRQNLLVFEKTMSDIIKKGTYRRNKASESLI